MSNAGVFHVSFLDLFVYRHPQYFSCADLAPPLVFFRALKQEKRDVRMAITPLLQAEEDAKFVAAVSLEHGAIGSVRPISVPYLFIEV